MIVHKTMRREFGARVFLGKRDENKKKQTKKNEQGR